MTDRPKFLIESKVFMAIKQIMTTRRAEGPRPDWHFRLIDPSGANSGLALGMRCRKGWTRLDQGQGWSA
jgi:hypothetical protein